MIKSLHIKNFMAHTELVLSDIAGINIILGKNDTGKTGLMKLLYASLKSMEVYSKKKKAGNDTTFKRELSAKLSNTFMPKNRGLGDLVQKGNKQHMSADFLIKDELGRYQQNIAYSISEKAEESVTACTDLIAQLPEEINALFVPAKEVLTAFFDIRNIRNSFYGTGFDDTYLDLINDLDLPTTRGRVADELSSVNKTLEALFEGKIKQTGEKDQPFIFKKGKHEFAMQQTSEGIKKIGILTTLINNRRLGKGTVLFMDEPETALHPGAARQMVEMLVAMSRAGVQVFLASHSYFIIKQLAICAKRDKVLAQCWNLTRNIGENVRCSIEELTDGILPNNDIVEEALKMYDSEIDLNLKG